MTMLKNVSNLSIAAVLAASLKSACGGESSEPPIDDPDSPDAGEQVEPTTVQVHDSSAANRRILWVHNAAGDAVAKALVSEDGSAVVEDLPEDGA